MLDEKREHPDRQERIVTQAKESVVAHGLYAQS